MELLDLEDLDTRGFVVLRSFLGEDDIGCVVEDHASAPLDGNGNYRLRTASAEALDRLRPRLLEVAAEVGRRTSTSVDTLIGANYFATGAVDGIEFMWHQDSESWFFLQDHHHYLNFYIPVVKPDASRSNLSIVPFDALAREGPHLYRAQVGRGGTDYVSVAGCSVAFDAERARMRVLRGGLDHLAVTPELDAGDLLLLRGDIIHRTQDSATDRVALSVRMANGSGVVRRAQLARGGAVKAAMLARNPQPTRRLLRAFDDAGRDELTIGEMRERVEAVGPLPGVGRRTILAELLLEKRRQGELGRLALTVPATAAYAGLRGWDRLVRTRRRRVPRPARVRT